jgi:hypothetical protein
MRQRVACDSWPHLEQVANEVRRVTRGKIEVYPLRVPRLPARLLSGLSLIALCLSGRCVEPRQLPNVEDQFVAEGFVKFDQSFTCLAT